MIKNIKQSLLVTFQYPNFRYLIIGRTLIYFSNTMVPIALSFAVLDITGSLLSLGLVLSARSIANILLLLIGGILADRLPHSLLLQGSSIISGVSLIVIVMCYLLGFNSIPILMVLSAINGMMSAISLPASAAMVQATVPSKKLLQANGIARLGLNIGMMGGLSLGSILVTIIGPLGALVINAVAFLLAAIYFKKIYINQPTKREDKQKHFLTEFRQGWNEFKSHRWVWIIILQFMLVNGAVAGGIYVLGPKIADETIGRLAWGFVLTAQTIGALFGAILATQLNLRYALRFGVAMVAFEALPLIILSTFPQFYLLLIASFFNGIAIEQFGVTWELSLQHYISPNYLARIYSYDALGSFIALPLGEITIALIANSIGVQTTLLAAAILIVLATSFALAFKDVNQLTTYPPDSISKLNPP